MDNRLPARLAGLTAHPLIVAALIWAVLAAFRLYAGWDFVLSGKSPDPDSAMRLLQVRDWLAGQGWWDLTQHRMGPAGGTAMHWSRLADLLPAAISGLLSPWCGQAMAERIAQIATPLIYLFPVVLVSVAIARNLAGRAADALVGFMLLTAIGTLGLFVPGAIDHHNLQLLFMLLIVWAGSGERRAMHGVVAGVATVASMTVGIEIVPEVAAALAATGLLWVFDPTGEARFFRAIGMGMMAAAFVAIIFFMPQPWPMEYCDGWTPAVFILMVAGGAMVAVVAGNGFALRARWPVRIAMLGIGTALIAVAIASAFPACLRYPAGDDMISWRYWMDNITELESLKTIWQQSGPGPVVILLNTAPLVIIVAIWTALRQADNRWWTAIATALAALAMTIAQVRAQPFLGAVVAILAAALVVQAFRSGAPRLRIGALALLPIGWMLAGAAMLRPEAAPHATADQGQCRSNAVIAALRRLPPSLIVVPMTAEPHILLETAHRSLGGTYHRNIAGNHAMIGAMIAEPSAAQPILRKAGAQYLLYCPGYDIGALYAKGNPQSLAAALVANRAPAWLTPVAQLPPDIRLYRID